MKRTLDTAAVVLATLLLLGFAVLSVRGIIDPQTAAARFGAEVNDALEVFSGLLFIPLKCEAHAGQYTSSREKTKGIELCISYVLPKGPSSTVFAVT